MSDHFTKLQEASLNEQGVARVATENPEHHKPRVFMPFDLVGLAIIAIVAYFYFQPDTPVQAPAMVATRTLTTAADIEEEAPLAEPEPSLQADESATLEATGPADYEEAAPVKASEQSVQSDEPGAPATTATATYEESAAVAELDPSPQHDGTAAPEPTAAADNEKAAAVAGPQQTSPPETTIALRALLSEPEESTDASAAAVTGNPLPEPVTADTGQTVLSRAGKPAISWAVNLLSTTSRSAAERVNLRLQAGGTLSEMIQVQVRGRTYYRIHVADFSSYQQAYDAQQSFRANTAYKDAWVSRHSR
ncbi:MAG: hypothetical protein AUJ57_06710 [Zetaproteobacteria bacterium CG1_02_53_45]|nr:MAG: hypothetical protein AUJ57_06710 [Zetaproteobacteria bacterium CG1_02_53_45]